MNHPLTRSLLLATSLLLAVTPFATHADDREDFYIQQSTNRYFDYTQSARTFGMAGATVVTSTDSSSVKGNPAGLGFMPYGELSGSYSYNRISGDEFPLDNKIKDIGQMGSGDLAIPLGATEASLPEFGNLGLSWNTSDTKWKNDSFDTLSKRTQIVLAYARPLSEDLSLGYSLGWNTEKFQSRDVFNAPMGDGFRHTLGAQYRVNHDTLIGTTAFVGSGARKITFGPGQKAKSRALETGASVGVSTGPVDSLTVALSADYQHYGTRGDLDSGPRELYMGGDENGNTFGAHAGLEYLVTDAVTLRAGYHYAGLSNYRYNRVELNPLNGSANYNAWNAGVGFNLPINGLDSLKVIRIDYGAEYRDAGNGDWQHLVTVAIPFSPCGTWGAKS